MVKEAIIPHSVSLTKQRKMDGELKYARNTAE